MDYDLEYSLLDANDSLKDYGDYLSVSGDLVGDSGTLGATVSKWCVADYSIIGNVKRFSDMLGFSLHIPIHQLNYPIQTIIHGCGYHYSRGIVVVSKEQSLFLTLESANPRMRIVRLQLKFK